MKNQVILLITLLSLYACSDRSSNHIEPTEVHQSISNQRIGKENLEEVLDAATIISTRYDKEISDELNHIYELNPEIDAILWAEKGQGILGIKFLEDKEKIEEKYTKGFFEFYDCECARKADAIGDSFKNIIQYQQYIQNCLKNQFQLYPIKGGGNGVVSPLTVIPDITDYLRACSKYKGEQ